MNLLKLLENWNPEDQSSFKEELAIALNENTDRLPIDDLLQSGGWIEDCEYSVDDDIDETEDSLVAEVSVFFTESIPTSCADMSFPEARQGRLTITINKKTGEANAEITSYGEGDSEYY